MPRTEESVTWYRTVCDLESLRILLFRRRDFPRAVMLDLATEPAKSDRTVDTDGLIQRQVRPYSAPARSLFSTLLRS